MRRGRTPGAEVPAVAAPLLAAGLVLGGLLLAGGAPPAGAHATLIGTIPTADAVVATVPEAVELRFDEPVEPVDDAVEVYGPDGARVDRGVVETGDGGATLAAPVGGDAAGTYTVAWRVTSEDGHTLSGSFVFHNGTRTGAAAVGGGDSTTTDVAGGVGRWLGLAGTMTAVGAATVALLLPHPSRGDGPPGDDGEGGPGDLAGGTAPVPGTSAHEGLPGEGEGGSGRHATAVTAGPGAVPAGPPPDSRLAWAGGPLRPLAVVGGAAGAVGAFVALLAILADASGRTVPGALGLVTEAAPDTRTGRLALARVGLGAATALAALLLRARRRGPVTVLVLGAATIVVTTTAGHAWTAPDRGVAVASDVIHLVAVSAWIGGLVGLLAVLPGLGRHDRVGVATRFSGLALGAVAVVAASGTVSGWQQVGTLDGLTSTSHGRLLLAKVVGLAALVVAGWVNRARLAPLVGRTVGPLRRSLRAEVVVAAVVLALTAALVHQPPARSLSPGGPFDTTAEAPGGEVLSATVDPAEAGPNDIHLYFGSATGGPLTVDAVQVTASTTGVPARRLQVTPVSTDHVIVTGASLPSPGSWTVETTAVAAGQPLVFTFEVPIS